MVDRLGAAAASCRRLHPHDYIGEVPDRLPPELVRELSRIDAVRYVGRIASASPATGSPDSHALERKLILEEAFANLA